MTRPHTSNTLGLTPQQYARRMDLAKDEAHRLRREAIDAFAGMLIDCVRSAIDGWRRRAPIAPAARKLSEPCQR
jgi:hypothetical protein